VAIRAGHTAVTLRDILGSKKCGAIAERGTAMAGPFVLLVLVSIVCLNKD